MMREVRVNAKNNECNNDYYNYLYVDAERRNFFHHSTRAYLMMSNCSQLDKAKWRYVFFFWSVKNSFPVSRFSSSSRDILKGINLFGGLELKIVFIYKNIKTDIFIAYFSRYHLHRAIDKVITVFITL